METRILKVMAQGEPSYVPSKKTESGQVAKCMIRLKALGGDFEDEFICTMFGNLALCKFAMYDVVVATLRFSTHEYQGQVFQEILCTDLVKLKN